MCTLHFKPRAFLVIFTELLLCNLESKYFLASTYCLHYNKFKKFIGNIISIDSCDLYFYDQKQNLLQIMIINQMNVD